MPTDQLFLERPTGSLKLYRVRWYDDAGKRHARTFGTNRREAVERFDAFRAAWASSWYVRNPDQGGPLTIAVAWKKYEEHADQYYRRADGTPTREAKNVGHAFAYVLDDFGGMNVDDFGPRTLKAAREKMIAAGVSRRVVNQYANKIRRVFRWFVSEEMADPAILAGLQAVEPVRRGRTSAAERDRVQAVDLDDVDATVEHLSPTLAALVRFIQWTGCRPGEACAMRLADLDMSGDVWIYRPGQHKKAHREGDADGVFAQEGRTVLVGPNAQAAVRPYLGRPIECAVFSPAVAEAETAQARREAYQAADDALGDYRDWPSYTARLDAANAKRAKRASDPSVRYSTDSLRRAIARAVDAAKAAGNDVATWSPNQLRHAAATRLATEFGLVAAKTALGHSKIETTEIYAERDQAEARSIIGRIG